MSSLPEWCCVRLRFSADEVALLKGAEVVAGAALSQEGRPSSLRDALTLMRAVRKVAARAGSPVSLGTAETAALLAAVRTTLTWLERYHDYVLGWRGAEPLAPEEVALMEQAFPMARGSAGQTSHLMRALQALRARLEAPLTPS